MLVKFAETSKGYRFENKEKGFFHSLELLQFATGDHTNILSLIV